MQQTCFTYEIITPLCIGGAVRTEPELRPPSLKGAMRFWWRAICSNLTNENLRKQEAKIFGTSDEIIGKSKFSLRIRGIPDDDSFRIQVGEPGKTPVSLKCLKPGETFEIILSSSKYDVNHSLYENILMITLALVCLGKRSRRGMGSLNLLEVTRNGVVGVVNEIEVPVENTQLLALLNNVLESEDNSYKDNNGRIQPSWAIQLDYPYIKEIQIGKTCLNYNKLLGTIASSAHNNNSIYTGFVSKLDKRNQNKPVYYPQPGKGGTASPNKRFVNNKNRLSSPIYVSILKDAEGYRPIITTLNVSLGSDLSNLPSDNPFYTDKSSAFKDEILRGVVL